MLLPKRLLSLSAFRLNLPKNTLQWLALVGFLWFYPPGSGSGSSDSQAFTCSVRSASHLRFASLPPAFRAAFYRSPDVTKLIHLFRFCNFSGIYFQGRNAQVVNRSY